MDKVESLLVAIERDLEQLHSQGRSVRRIQATIDKLVRLRELLGRDKPLYSFQAIGPSGDVVTYHIIADQHRLTLRRQKPGRRAVVSGLVAEEDDDLQAILARIVAFEGWDFGVDLRPFGWVFRPAQTAYRLVAVRGRYQLEYRDIAGWRRCLLKGSDRAPLLAWLYEQLLEDRG